MIDLLKFDFSEMQIFDNYLIVTINEGFTVSPSNNKTLMHIANTYYSNKDFVYISYRKHSYSVDPAVYYETSKIKNLIGFAVVSSNFKTKSNAEIEKLFLNKPFETFNNLEDAVVWAKSLLK